MNKDQLTLNQRRAIETLDRSCVVTAGPGAGKTRVLVERVLNLLRQGKADLDQIAAITFTNKAANEMKQKIRRMLLDLAQSAMRASDARRWHELRRRVDSAQISTIHGFCSSVLRAQPVETQTDPEFTILEEYTSRLLLLNAAEEAINNLVDERDEIAARLITGYTRRGLIEALIRLYEATRTLGLTLEEVERLTLSNLSTLSDYQAAVAAVEEMVDDMFCRTELKGKMREQAQAVRETWTRSRPRLSAEPRLEDARVFDECLDAMENATPHKRGKIAEPAELLESQLEDLRLIFYDLCGRDTLVALISILRRIEARYREARAEQGGLDYEDLQLRVRDLFRTHPWLARQYASKYRFILVDEFQDTNRLQKEILDLLMAGREAGNSDFATNLFIVGDARQSIYNFRGAAVEVFAEAGQELEKQGAATIVLDTNFRSAESLVRFFNEFFSRLMRLGPDQNPVAMQQLGYVEFIANEASRGVSPHPPVELLLEIGAHVKSAEAGRELEAERIAARIAEMVQSGQCLVGESTEDGQQRFRPVRYGDIAVLFRAMTSTKVYEQALRKRGIPYYVLAGKGFYQREEIQDMLSLLRFLENRTDEIALVSALRSPLFGISDETLYWLRQHAERRSHCIATHDSLLSSLLDYQAISELSADQVPLVAAAAETLAHLPGQRNRVSLRDLVEEILTTTSYEALQATCFDGHQRIANLRKLVDLARDFEARGPHFLRDFIHYIAQFTEMETRESEAQLESGIGNAVQIMTVHKAKGVEFPVVIIPDLARRFRMSAPELAFDRSLGIGMKIPDPRGFLHETRLRQRVARQIEQREFFESQRVLFVAATRAKDHLILSGASPKQVRNQKPETGNQKIAASDLQGATSWLEWICAILGTSDPQTLPEVYQWNGLQLRVAPSGELAAEIGTTMERIVDRFPETLNGEPVPPDELPALTEPDQRDFQLIVRRIEPITIERTTTTQSMAVTRLVSFAQCPLKYYYESILGLPGQDEYETSSRLIEPFPSDGELSGLVRGTIIHRFCEEYDGSEDWEPVLRRFVDEEVGAVATGDLDDARRRAFAQARPLVERYLHSEVWQQIEQILWSGKGGRVESEVEFVYHTGVMPLRGRIDKLIVRDEGRATIVDFKTHRVMPEEVEELAREHELQMRVYAIGVRQALRREDVRAEFYFLEPNVRFQVDQRRLDATQTAQELDELCQQVLKVRGIQDAIARPSATRCRRCQYFSFCPSRAI
ncbi:MAG: UvrD-helicase domain-containing protein [Acidobacteria bacterium]|nr:UvrD-helicase domain-containing protein [Acidobacteriota bacterium]